MITDKLYIIAKAKQGCSLMDIARLTNVTAQDVRVVLNEALAKRAISRYALERVAGFRDADGEHDATERNLPLDTLARSIAERVVSLIQASLATSFQNSLASAVAGKMLWTEAEAAACLGVKHGSLRQWRHDGLITASTTVRPILYTREQIEAARDFLLSENRPMVNAVKNQRLSGDQPDD